RLPATLTLAGSALAIAIVGGLAAGVLSAASRSYRLLAIVRIIPLAGQAVPTFWLGAMLMLIFAVRLGWLPSSGNATADALILPALSLAAHPGSIIARLVSTGMRDLERSDFVRTAQSKG